MIIFLVAGLLGLILSGSCGKNLTCFQTVTNSFVRISKFHQQQQQFIYLCTNIVFFFFLNWEAYLPKLRMKFSYFVLNTNRLLVFKVITTIWAQEYYQAPKVVQYVLNHKHLLHQNENSILLCNCSSSTISQKTRFFFMILQLDICVHMILIIQHFLDFCSSQISIKYFYSLFEKNI